MELLQYELSRVCREIYDTAVNGGQSDYAASRGEYLNAVTMARALQWQFIDAADIIRFDNDNQLDLALTKDTVRECFSAVDPSQRVIIPGFYGTNKEGKVVTFSRGGSDITGS